MDEFVIFFLGTQLSREVAHATVHDTSIQGTFIVSGLFSTV